MSVLPPGGCSDELTPAPPLSARVEEAGGGACRGRPCSPAGVLWKSHTRLGANRTSVAMCPLQRPRTCPPAPPLSTGPGLPGPRGAWGAPRPAPAHGRLASLSAADVKFISNPPSMVAAGSVVAAVQGLHLGSSGSFLSYHRLTRFLSKVIKCDPVGDRGRRPCWAGVLPGPGR